MLTTRGEATEREARVIPVCYTKVGSSFIGISFLTLKTGPIVFPNLCVRQCEGIFILKVPFGARLGIRLLPRKPRSMSALLYWLRALRNFIRRSNGPRSRLLHTWPKCFLSSAKRRRAPSWAFPVSPTHALEVSRADHHPGKWSSGSRVPGPNKIHQERTMKALRILLLCLAVPIAAHVSLAQT